MTPAKVIPNVSLDVRREYEDKLGMGHMGRKTKLTPETLGVIKDNLMAGAPLTLAAEAAGVAGRTLQHWRDLGEKHPESIYGCVADWVRQWRATAALNNIKELQRQGDAGNKAWAARAWTAHNQYPDLLKQRHDDKNTEGNQMIVQIGHVEHLDVGKLLKSGSDEVIDVTPRELEP